MNDHAHDLNSNMLVPHQQPQSEPTTRRYFSLLNPSSIAVRRNLTREMRQSINDSINYNVSLIVFSVIKIIASSIVLHITDQACDKALRQWIYYMMIHDFTQAVILGLKIKTIATSAFSHRLLPEEQNRNEEEAPARDIFGYNLNSDESVFTLSEEAEKKNRIISALVAVVKTYYYTLFIYAQVLYFHTETNCPTAPHTLMRLVMAYVGFGYIYIGMPILFIILACLCLPFLLFFSYLFARGEQVPVTKETLKNLPVIDYTSELPGNHECSICMGEYVEGDKLIQLKCSPMHHFHDECLKKWLKINGLCPICRGKIEDDKGPKPGDLEMANTTLNSQNSP